MFFIGDTHGIRPVFSIIDRAKLEGQTIIHVGDFGLGFVPLYSDLKNLEATDEMLLETNNTMFVVRGNHDNPVFWDKSKGLNLPKLHNLHLVDDYELIRVEGQTILCVGGGISIDRTIRKDHTPPSWWKDEVFVLDHNKLNKAMLNARRNGQNIDIVVTHTSPTFTYPLSDNVGIVNDWHGVEMSYGVNLKDELRKERLDVTELHDELKHEGKFDIKHWIYGHFHASKREKIDNTEFVCLNVNELWELPKK